MFIMFVSIINFFNDDDVDAFDDSQQPPPGFPRSMRPVGFPSRSAVKTSSMSFQKPCRSDWPTPPKKPIRFQGTRNEESEVLTCIYVYTCVYIYISYYIYICSKNIKNTSGKEGTSFFESMEFE